MSKLPADIVLDAETFCELVEAMTHMAETIQVQHDELQGLRRVMQRRMRPLRGVGVGPLVQAQS